MNAKLQQRANDLFSYLMLVVFVAITFFLLLFSSCSSKKAVVTNKVVDKEIVTTTSDKESVVKDTIVGVSADSAYMHLQLACDSMGNAYIKDIEKMNGERVSMGLQIEQLMKQLSERAQGSGSKDLFLSVECNTDSLSIVIEKQREIIKEYESRVDSTSHNELVTEYVKYVPDYYASCTKGFWWLLGIDLAVIALIVLYYVGKNTPWGKAVLSGIKVYFKFFA